MRALGLLPTTYAFMTNKNDSKTMGEESKIRMKEKKNTKTGSYSTQKRCPDCIEKKECGLMWPHKQK